MEQVENEKNTPNVPIMPEEDKQFHDEEINQRIIELPLKEKLKAIALNNLYKERKSLNDDLEKEIKELTFKYEKMSQPFYEKANEIIDGSRFPNENELKGLDQFLTYQEKQDKNNALDASAIVGYWAKVFQNCDLLAHEIKEKDGPVFNHLIKIEYEKHYNNLDFSIRFFFDDSNPYFKNSILQKTFLMIDDDTPLKTEGTMIEWKNDMNLTTKIIKRKQKNKKTFHTKMIEKQIDDDSFFLFFKSISDELVQEKKGENTNKNRMDIDYDIARIIVDDVIPFSLEYYLGMGIQIEDLIDGENEIDNPKNNDKSPKKLNYNDIKISLYEEKNSNYSEDKSPDKNT